MWSAVHLVAGDALEVDCVAAQAGPLVHFRGVHQAEPAASEGQINEPKTACSSLLGTRCLFKSLGRLDSRLLKDERCEG